MQLILFRHGIAENARDGLPDAERALTPRGVERTAAAARGLARFTQRPQAILTSPKTRALQTAAIIGDTLDLVPTRAAELAAESLDPILRLLRSRDEDRVLLVGHEPTLSALIELLCGGRAEMKKAGAALLDGDPAPGHAVLQWLLSPRALRLMGGSTG